MAGETINTNYVANRLPAQNYFTQAYSNMVGLSDLADDTLGYGAASLGCGSIFGGGMYPMGNMYGSMYGMGYGPGSERMNMSQIDSMRYDSKIRDYQLQENIRQQKQMEGAQFSVNAAKDVILAKAGVLQSVVKDNDQDAVAGAYQNLYNAAKGQLEEAGFTNATPDQIRAYASKLYYEATGKRITADLEEHGDGNFLHGFKQGLGCGLGALLTNNRSTEENISEITGKPESTASKAWSWVGRITAGALTIAAGVLLFKRAGNIAHFVTETKNSYRTWTGERHLTKAAKAAEKSGNEELIDKVGDMSTKFEDSKVTAAESDAKFHLYKADKKAGKLI